VNHFIPFSIFPGHLTRFSKSPYLGLLIANFGMFHIKMSFLKLQEVAKKSFYQSRGPNWPILPQNPPSERFTGIFQGFQHVGKADDRRSNCGPI
jgi:hypothetical protein